MTQHVRSLRKSLPAGGGVGRVVRSVSAWSPVHPSLSTVSTAGHRSAGSRRAEQISRAGARGQRPARDGSVAGHVKVPAGGQVKVPRSSSKVPAVLTAAGLQGSMGRIASAGDNAAMESWHALLQKNVLDRRRWRTREELHEAIVFWRAHLQPPPTAASPRQAHAGRVRTRLHHPGRSRCGMITTHPVSTDAAAVPPSTDFGRRLISLLGDEGQVMWSSPPFVPPAMPEDCTAHLALAALLRSR